MLTGLPPIPSTSTTKPSIATDDTKVPQPGNDGVTSLTWSPSSDNKLVSSNWDGGIRVWDVQAQSDGKIGVVCKAQAHHVRKAAVLGTCFSADGSAVFSGGGDNAVRGWQLGGRLPGNDSIAPRIGGHDGPVKAVAYLNQSNVVVSGSWDGTLRFWDTRSPTAAANFAMPERVYDLDVRDNLMVVATAEKHILIYDVSGTPREISRVVSPTDCQTRCVSCFPGGKGYAIGSIDGRVAIQYVQKVPGKNSFMFRCHQQGGKKQSQTPRNAFPVNVISFNNRFGTFATAGSDGVVKFWDLDNKNLLKCFDPISRTIPCASFSVQGNMFAYASSYDWSKGSAHSQQGNEIFIHPVNDNEVRPKTPN